MVMIMENKKLEQYINKIFEYNYIDSLTGETITIKENPAITIKTK